MMSFGRSAPPTPKTWKDKHITDWSKQDVSEWLQRLGPLKPYVVNFAHFNGAKLCELTAQGLDELVPNEMMAEILQQKLDEKKQEVKSTPDPVVSTSHHDAYIVGLQNMGNSCYLNSASQALLSVKEFVEHFRSDDNSYDSYRQAEVLRQWGDLCKQTSTLSNKHKVFSPRKFRQALARIDPRWGNGAQDNSLFLLCNTLKLLDEQINETQQLQIPATELLVVPIGPAADDNDANDDDHKCDERHLIESLLHRYNPLDQNIVRTVFDGILCETSICCKCGYGEQKYAPFRFLRLPLRSQLVMLPEVKVYIAGEQFKPSCHPPLMLRQIELVGYCSIRTLKALIARELKTKIKQTLSEESIHVLAWETQAAAADMDRMFVFEDDSQLCRTLVRKRFAVLVSHDAKPVVMLHSRSEANAVSAQTLMEFPSSSDTVIDRTEPPVPAQHASADDHDPNTTALRPVFYVGGGFVEGREQALAQKRYRVILVLWVDAETYEFVRTKIKEIEKFKNVQFANHVQTVMQFIDDWGLLKLKAASQQTLLRSVMRDLPRSLGPQFCTYNPRDSSSTFEHILDSLQEYLQTLLFDKNAFAFFCKQCDEYSYITERRREIALAPKSLIIYIDRVQADGSANMHKLNDAIKYDINGLRIDESTGHAGKPGKATYDLTAVVHHGGSFGGGHYSANVRNVHNRTLWFYTSDSITNRISEGQVAGRDCMLLVYEKNMRK